MYSELIEKGWTIEEIDNMDFLLYLDILLYRIKSNKKDNEKDFYIDEINWL